MKVLVKFDLESEISDEKDVVKLGGGGELFYLPGKHGKFRLEFREHLGNFREHFASLFGNFIQQKGKAEVLGAFSSGSFFYEILWDFVGCAKCCSQGLPASGLPSPASV